MSRQGIWTSVRKYRRNWRPVIFVICSAFSCFRGWRVRERDNSWGGETRVPSGFSAAQLMYPDLLFCWACKELTYLVLRLRYHCGTGGRWTTWCNVTNPELKVRGPVLYTQLSSFKLHEFGQMTNTSLEPISLTYKIRAWAALCWQRWRTQFNYTDDPQSISTWTLCPETLSFWADEDAFNMQH